MFFFINAPFLFNTVIFLNVRNYISVAEGFTIITFVQTLQHHLFTFLIFYQHFFNLKNP
jgi:hypothetical protein